MAKNKVTEPGKTMKMNSIVDSGLEISQTDLENIFGKTGMCLRANGKLV